MAFINPVIPLNQVKPINALAMSSSGGNVPIADYITCLSKVQNDFPKASTLQVLGSVRNLYYTGLKFQYLIPRSVFISQHIDTTSPESMEAPVTPVDQLPKWRDKQTLEKLKLRAHENGQEDNPSPYLEIVNNGKSELIDVGHLLLTIDALQHSQTGAPYATYGIPNIDIASWIADIAIAAYWNDFLGKNGMSKLINDADFVEIEGRDPGALRKKMISRSSGPTEDDFFEYSAPDSDLLGDIDGFVMNHFFKSHPNASLSQLFYLYYTNTSGKFVDKRFWFFCFLNQMNYNYATMDWANVNSIYTTYLPRIDRCVDLFYSGALGAIGNLLKSPISSPAKGSYVSSKIYLQKFLDWLKPRLQAELTKVQGRFLPSSGNMFP